MLLLLLLLLLPLLLLLSLLLLLQLAVDVQDVHETVVEEEVDAGDRAISFARLAARRLLTGAHPACSLSTGFGPLTESSGHSAYVFPRAGGEHGTSSGVPTLRI